MGKRRRNPYANSYACARTPHKVRYMKAAFAWEVGARQMKKTGVRLFMYRCDDCKGGWHLTRRHGADATPITTSAFPFPEVLDPTDALNTTKGNDK
jgi:hypothetical protein